MNAVGDEGIPVDGTTLPSAAVVHLVRWVIERNRREQNERDARRVALQRRRDDDPKRAA